MPSKEIALETAAFLDSPQARGLSGVTRADLRRAADALVEGCYEGLGKAPRTLDGEDVRALLGEVLPARFQAGDALARRVVEIAGAFFAHVRDSQLTPEAFEIERALEQHGPAFESALARGGGARSAQKDAPFVHGASKLGRNDPCSCGSGKKYKKCHGKE